MNKTYIEENVWIELVPLHPQYNIIKHVVDIASISRGRFEFVGDNSKRVNLYFRLLKESGGEPSVPIEFIPIYFFEYVITQEELNAIVNNPGTYVDKVEYYRGKYKVMGLRTNFRFLYSNIEMVRENADNYTFDKKIKDFMVIRGEIPFKVLTHLRTHRAFSFIVESSRNKRYLNNVKFYYPQHWNEERLRIMKEKDKEIVDKMKDLVYKKILTPEEATMELGDRRIVKFAMAAWKDNPFAWENLFRVRGDGTGTMGITNKVVQTIKKVIEYE